MTLSEKIIDHIEKTVSVWEAFHAEIVLRLLSAHFASCVDGFLRATGEQLATFLRSRGNADTTFVRRLSTLKLIFATLVEWRMIESNPAMDVERPAIGDKAPDFNVSLGAVERVIAHQTDLVERLRGPKIHTERLILALTHLLAAGVFLAEVENLVVRDLHPDHHILAGRGESRERPVWLFGEAARAVNAAVHSGRQLPPAPDAPLLVTKRGNTPGIRGVWKYVQRAIVRAGLNEAGLTPAKLHRGAAKAVLGQGFGWEAARCPSAYRRIPLMEKRPSVDELEQAIKRNHPFEFV
jgi:site-specific recombinase XerD